MWVLPKCITNCWILWTIKRKITKAKIKDSKILYSFWEKMPKKLKRIKLILNKLWNHLGISMEIKQCLLGNLSKLSMKTKLLLSKVSKNMKLNKIILENKRIILTSRIKPLDPVNSKDSWNKLKFKTKSFNKKFKSWKTSFNPYNLLTIS